MNAKQLLTLMNRIDREVDSEIEDIRTNKGPEPIDCKIQFGFDSDKVNKVIYINGAYSVKIEYHSYRSTLSVEFKNGKINIAGIQYKIRQDILRWLSPVWRKWNSMSKKIYKAHKEGRKRRDYQEFNKAYYECFSEELDSIILGDKDV